MIYQKTKIFKILWIIYSLFIIYGTLIPFNLVPSNEIVLSNYHKISWMPFIDPDGSRASIPDIVQNILLFLPFGILSFLSMHHRKWNRIFLSILLGSLLSIFVEILQLFTIDRTTSATDLITNTAGTFFGVLAAVVTLDLIAKIITFQSLQKHLQIRCFFPFLICCIVVTVGALQPFDFSLDVGFLWSRLKFLVNEPINFTTVISDEGVVIIRFFLSGLICSLCFWEWGCSHPVIKGIILSSLMGIGLEGCQIIIESRMPSIHDSAVVVLSSTFGGLIAVYQPRRVYPNIWSFIFIITTWIAAMLNAFSPFQFGAEYKSMNWVPFLPYYDKTSFIALSNFIESVLLYFPMGFVIAYFMPKKKSPYVFIIIITSLISVPLEFSQGWVDGRYPDITDVLGALIGAIFGAWTCREGWKAFERYSYQKLSVHSGCKKQHELQHIRS